MALGLLWAVLAAVGTNIVVGMLWYGPLFGKPWSRAMGWGDISAAQKKEMQQKAMPGYIISMLSAALATFLLWFVYDWATDTPDYAPWLKGLVLGFTAWLALYVGPTLTSTFFEGRRWLVWAIGAGYWGVLAMMYGVYVGVFQ